MHTWTKFPFKVDVEIVGTGRAILEVWAYSHTAARRQCIASKKGQVVIIHGVTCDNPERLA